LSALPHTPWCGTISTAAFRWLARFEAVCPLGEVSHEPLFLILKPRLIRSRETRRKIEGPTRLGPIAIVDFGEVEWQ
jgi:hypothetical protein